ncbi:cytochrome P450 [Amylocystis lapponica]|nr:cytochrome P450 [Amylocystis lapponica]
MELYVLTAVFAGLVLLWQTWQRRLRLPLPPSPPADPIIGHFRTIPRSHQSEVYYEWSKKYGDIFYLHVFGRPMVILNSLQAANDLLEKRSANYSDRPRFPLFELMGWEGTVTFLRYGDQFFKQRKLLQQYFSRQNCVQFQHIHRDEARRLLKNLVDKPEDFDWLVRRFGSAVVMKITYGHQIESDDDEYIKMTENVSEAHALAGDPGSTPVDIFPILRHLPPWFPGAWFIRVAYDWQWAIRRFHDFPFKAVQKHMAAGTAEESFLSSHIEAFLQEGYQGEHTMDDLKSAAGAIYAGGAETSWSTIVLFIFSMVLHPNVMTRAQQEIDDIVGTDRLPEFSDREKLSYVECVLQEVMRCRSMPRIGVPHRTLEDDMYNGMFIPKGTLVFASARSMALDEVTYRNPREFRPERYLPAPDGSGEPFPSASFGFGRRICPGRFLADGSVWMAIVSLLATMKITKAVGEDGKEITPDVKFTSGLSSHPKPFKCDIRPRSDAALSLIMNN